MAVQFVEDGREELLAVLHDVSETDPAAFDVRFVEVGSDRRHVADLLRNDRAADGEDGTQS